MWSKLLTLTVATSFAFYSTALGQTNFTTNWNPTGEGCVDTTGFISCYNDHSNTGVSCQQACANNNKKGTAEYNTCMNGCEALWLAGNVGCWLQSCWNQVYSCAYQLTAMSYFDGAGLQQNSNVPFYPPPNDASAGACSCNIGYVYGNLSSVSQLSQGSNCQVISAGDNTVLYNCECCELSWPVSNILNVCPKSDLSVMGFPGFVKQVASQLAPSADKCAILRNGTETCINNYNFPYEGRTAYNPLALPSGEPGTQALSNSAGNAFTVFPSPVLTLSLLPALTYTSVITPAAFAASASANPQSILGTSILGLPTTTSASVSTTSKAASTGTGSAATTSATKASSGMKMERNQVFLLLAVGSTIVGML